jgi:hypothetical protein
MWAVAAGQAQQSTVCDDVSIACVPQANPLSVGIQLGLVVGCNGGCQASVGCMHSDIQQTCLSLLPHAHRHVLLVMLVLWTRVLHTRA